MGQIHRIRGRVMAGRRLGRRLGFPTANLAVEGVIPADRQGVWLARALLSSADKHWALVNIGTKPTVQTEHASPSVEAWLMDYSGGELYGELITLELMDYLRAEEQFDSLDALRDALEKDRIIAQKIITTHEYRL